MLLFGFAAMNGFCGAIVGFNGCALTACPWNAGSEGGGGVELIGTAPAVAAIDNPARRIRSPNAASLRRFGWDRGKRLPRILSGDRLLGVRGLLGDPSGEDVAL